MECLQGYSGFENSYFAIAFSFVAGELSVCHSYDVIDEALQGMFHRFVFYDYPGVEINPFGLVLGQFGVGGNLHGRNVGAKRCAASCGEEH